ncbi:MAG: CRTAC1 family protein [Acidobacteriaceae bacterium]|nr:CRTAC1 family protein [Acidobacteriaceae bacterium]
MRRPLQLWLLCTFLLAAATAPLEYVSFRDVATSCGLTHPNVSGGREQKSFIIETTGTGVAIFDYDGDGRNDIFLVNGTSVHPPKTGPSPIAQLYHNDGDGKFHDVAREAGFTAEGWGQGVCVGDYDNDGHPDLLVTYWGHNILYRNLGGGKFQDVTAKAGLPVSGTRYGSGCAFLDYNKDGHLDIFVANYVDFDFARSPKAGSVPFCEWKGMAVACGPRALPVAYNVLYRNNGDGTFTDVSERAGILKPGGRYGLGVVSADFDNDGWPDIYVACDQTPSLLYYNQGNGTFIERGVEAGAAYNFDGQAQSGMGIAVADFDGNGFLDIAKTNFSGDLPSLYKNEDGRFFTDVSREAGLGAHHLLGWGAAFIDLDEDGWKDLVMANGHVYPEVDRRNFGDRYLQKTLVYRNSGHGKFVDISAAAGPAFEVERPARGLAVGDLDGDGRPEIVIANMNAVPSLLKNEAPARQNWLTLRLEGTKSNRSAIGARVTVEAGGRRQIDEVLGGGSYYSQSDFALHFGLGKAIEVDRITIRWPSGLKQELTRIPVNRQLLIREGYNPQSP